MDQVLPVLVGRIEHAGDVVAVLQAALRGGIAFVPLDGPPSRGGPHAVHLHLPGLQQPLLLLGEPAGEPLENEVPLLLQPYAEAHRGALAAFLARVEGAQVPEPEPEPARADGDRPSDSPLAGRVLGGGKYAILTQLGSGGMGSVYRARHVMLDKLIAVKVLHASHRHSDQFLAAFHREALAASRLDHPNVVRVLDFGREPDGLLYIAMELLEGRDLRAALDEQPVPPIARTLEVMIQVAAALSASHEQGIVHRDVKPENVFLVPRRDDDGTLREVVKVLDFGIAEAIHDGGPRSGATGAGPRRAITGTPDYMSPEQVRGQEVDARADIYACGVILFEMATGKVPFHAAETAEQIARMHVAQEPPRPSSLRSDVDRGLEALILKCLQKDPARRHPGARELRAELRALLEAQAPRQPSTASIVTRSPALAPGVVRAVVRPADADDDMHVIPVGARTDFQRHDAIDVGDLLTGGSSGGSPGDIKEQRWVLGEKLATALLEDPAGNMARIEAVLAPAAFAEEMALLERALVSLLTRGAVEVSAVVVSRLLQIAQGAPPGDGSRQALASRAFHSLATPGLALPLAGLALEGAVAARNPARWIVLQLGPVGAHALCTARVRASVHGAGWPGRPRFTAALREMAGLPGGAAAALRTLEAFLLQIDGRDVTLLEDLLRAVPEVPDERLGTLVGSRDLRHESPAVRRAAVTALAGTWGPRGNAWFAPLFEDPDDGVRIAALVALRRHGGVNLDLVQRIGRVLDGAPVGPDVRLAAVAALGDARGPAHTAAVELLTQALQASAGGRLSRFVTGEARADDAFVVAMARALLAMAGPPASPLVEARAAKSGADLRRELLALVNGAPVR